LGYNRSKIFVIASWSLQWCANEVSNYITFNTYLCITF
jgi:hypothetical protein